LTTGKIPCLRTREGITAFVILASVCLCFPLPLWAHDPEKSAITLEKDVDKTVYTIGPNERDTTKEDKDKAWEMLQGVVIDSRGSRGKGSDHNR